LVQPTRLARSAWLGLGAVAGALAVTSGQGRLVALTAGLSVVLGSAGLLRAVAGRARTDQVGPSSGPGPAAAGFDRIGLWLALGSLLLLGRAWLGGDLPDLAAGGAGTAPAAQDALTGRRLAIVVSVGSPKGTEQIALIDVVGPAHSRIGAIPRAGPSGPVEALLPRYPEVQPGDLIAVSGRVQPPGDDDYGAYLRQIGASGTLRSAILERLAGPVGLAGILAQIRQGSAAALARSLPEPQAGLASGILVGLRDRVDRDLAAAFTTAGVSHIVAISGWNIAIVAALVGALLGWLRRGPRTTISLVAIAAYTLVAGASPSVDRAALMASIGLLARASGRTSSGLAALGWAVLTLLLVEPGTVADPGFELSALATAGLIAWTAPLAARLGAARVTGRRAPGWLVESVAISLTAQAATLPVILLGFGRLSLVAPLANLVIVPLVPAAMAAGAIALIAGWLGGAGLPAPLVTALGLPGWALLGLIIWLVRFMAGLPLASLTLAPPWNAVGAAVASAAVGAVATGWIPPVHRPGLRRRLVAAR
jgi:competence protein ComEC